MAYIAFMDACRTYNKNRASFTTHCWIKVWYKLKSCEMRSSKKAADLPTVPIIIFDENRGHTGIDLQKTSLKEMFTTTTPYFNLEEFVEDLSCDAREIIKLLIETPHELLPARTPSALLRSAKQYLSTKWQNRDRVHSAISEVRRHVAWTLQRT